METLLLEIGTEEIPAGYIEPALIALSDKLLERLDQARIGHGKAAVYGTPRRLAIIVENIEKLQAGLEEEVLGPPVSAAYEADGRPKMAAIKFAEKIGVKVEELKTKDTPKGPYLCATRIEEAQPSEMLLRTILPEVILAVPFPKTMRWADLNITFARPIQNVLAILGSNIIPFELGNLESTNYSFGHRFMSPEKIKINSASEYIPLLRKAKVIADLEERRAMVTAQIEEVAAQTGGTVSPDEELVDIVKNLVETPEAVAGKFDDKFLEVPKEVLITAMRLHQKYFAVVDSKGDLMPNFIAVNNTRATDMALVAKGHERVLRARLEDARFFFKTDLEHKMDDWTESLKKVTLQAKLGTIYEKVERIKALAAWIADKSGIDNSMKTNVTRAAYLCKADLVSGMVGEFDNLQGVMGRVYALAAGENATVATAIEEHYMPVSSGSKLPGSVAGAILAMADKMDSICGCFSVDLIPTGASDPYALRRQSIGIIQILLDKEFGINLSDFVSESCSMFALKTDKKQDQTVSEVLSFIEGRLLNMLVEEGASKDAAQSSISVSSDNIPHIWKRVKAIDRFRQEADFESAAAAFKRIVNIIKKTDTTALPEVDEKLFAKDCERELYTAFANVRDDVIKLAENGNYEEALGRVADIRVSVDAFFDGVMVMDEDEKVRNNRLSLLSKMADTFLKVADFSKLSA